MADEEQIARIRATAYEKLEADPSGPNAGRLREILSSLPKVSKTRDPYKEPGSMRGGGVRQNAPDVHGELASGGDSGIELPPAPDERVDAEREYQRNPVKVASGLQKPPLGARALIAVGDERGRREFIRGVDDMVTFGGGQKLARKIGEAVGDTAFSDENQAEDRRLNPEARGTGQILGSVLPGAANYTGRVFGAAGSAATKLGGGVAGKTIAGTLGGAAANTLTMPTIAAGQAGVDAISRGENPLIDISHAFGNEIQNPLNPVVGAAAALLPSAARGIRSSGSQAGRDIRLVEEYGATPTPIGGASGGAFDSELLKGVHGSTREAGAMSRRAAREVAGGLEDEQVQLSNRYAAEKRAAGDQGFLEGRVRPDYVRAEAEKLLRGEGLTGGEKAAIEAEVTSALARHPSGMTVDDFNDFRQKLGRIFGTGPSDAAVPALDRLRQAAKRSVDETEMGPINERYHLGKENLGRKYEQLKLTPDTERRIQEERIAGQILRRGENTPTSGIQEPAIEDFLAENPQYKHLFDSISLLNAKERMGASLMSHGGSLYTRMHGALHHNLEPLQIGAYRLGGMLDDKGIAATLAARQLLGAE